ncbi:hypothetical protein [Staphylococcus saprophyticus]|uniref:hypothetical protein n=1 Tax=Staphylococcus saprophyticus TaxID=29385 RepID=UPI0034C5FB19
MSQFNKDFSNHNERSNSLFDKLISEEKEPEITKDGRTFPFYNSKDNFEAFIEELKTRDEKLKDLFHKLGDGGSHILTSEKNEIIENIIVQIDSIDRSYKELRQDLLNDKTSIKGLQLMHTTDLSAFDSIFDD